MVNIFQFTIIQLFMNRTYLWTLLLYSALILLTIIIYPLLKSNKGFKKLSKSDIVFFVMICWPIILFGSIIIRYLFIRFELFFVPDGWWESSNRSYEYRWETMFTQPSLFVNNLKDFRYL